jgi:hypothetical protein
MKNILRLILYILITLIVISVFSLLIFNDRISDYLKTSSNLEIVLSSPTKNIPLTKTIDPRVLKTPQLATLVNNVVNFNFSNICWRPDTFISPSIDLSLVSTSSTTESVVTPTTCRLGNEKRTS